MQAKRIQGGAICQAMPYSRPQQIDLAGARLLDQRTVSETIQPEMPCVHRGAAGVCRVRHGTNREEGYHQQTEASDDPVVPWHRAVLSFHAWRGGLRSVVGWPHNCFIVRSL
jgi:hypothetical protein